MEPRRRQQARRRQQTIAQRHQREAKREKQRRIAAFFIKIEQEGVRQHCKRRSLRLVAKEHGLELRLNGNEGDANGGFFHITYLGPSAITIYASYATVRRIVDLPAP